MPSGGARGQRTEAGGIAGRLLVLVLVGMVGLAGAVYLGWVPDPLTGTPAAPDAPPALREPPPSGPGLDLDPPPPPAPVLAGIDRSGASPTGKLEGVVAAGLASPRLGRHVGAAVAPLGAPRHLWTAAGSDVVTPASTMKLLTTLTALSVLGPEHRFETAVQQGKTRRQLVLVGGGDPLLTDNKLTAAEAAAAYPEPATLQQLAARTAAGLNRSDVHRVSLGYDDSLFVGPAVNPQWEPNYVPESVVSPIGALWVDEGRASAGLLARVGDPARTAAERFAVLLAKHAVRVDPAVLHVRASDRSAPLAKVESAPLAQIVQHVLEVSDNEAAEVLLRQLAIASGRPGSSAAGVHVVRKTLEGLGVDLSRAVIFDGSGLSRHDRLPVEALVDVLDVAADPGHPGLRAVITSLPVAGFNGGLADRFVSDAPAGLGVVRAKTGTLTGVHGLAGVALTRNARVLIFAAVADRVPVPKTLEARAQLDRVAASLAGCTC